MSSFMRQLGHVAGGAARGFDTGTRLSILKDEMGLRKEDFGMRKKESQSRADYLSKLSAWVDEFQQRNAAANAGPPEVPGAPATAVPELGDVAAQAAPTPGGQMAYQPQTPFFAEGAQQQARKRLPFVPRSLSFAGFDQ